MVNEYNEEFPNIKLVRTIFLLKFIIYLAHSVIFKSTSENVIVVTHVSQSILYLSNNSYKKHNLRYIKLEPV